MSPPILILGGYGNFGKRIAEPLIRDGYQVIIAGRNPQRANAAAKALHAKSVAFDANTDLDNQLRRLKPRVLINTCGPFQASDYRIAERCIANGVHYIDIADGRDFVTGISRFDNEARRSGVTVVSGASTVPGLSSAVLEAYRHEFSTIDELEYGISPGQRAERGLATTRGILTYVGQPLKPFAGHEHAYGWQDIYRQAYPVLGRRWMATCDIPDLDLLPERYGIATIRFSAGLELSLLHLSLWGLSWLIRFGVPINLPRFARPMLAVAGLLDPLGSADGGMHMLIRGKNRDGSAVERRWFIIAKDGFGPHIPTIPAIVLAKRLATTNSGPRGAIPCVGLVALDEYLAKLSYYPIEVRTELMEGRTQE